MRSRLVVLSIVAMTALTGCSDGTSPGEDAALDVGVFRDVQGNGQWSGSDWTDWDSPAAFGGAAAIVITGTVQSFAWGGIVDHTVLMKVSTTTKVKGAAYDGFDLKVSDIDVQGGPVTAKTVERFAKAIPVGTRLLAFLDSRMSLLGPQSLIFADAAGPQGAYKDLKGGFADATDLAGLTKDIAAPQCRTMPTVTQDLDGSAPGATEMDWEGCSTADKAQVQAEVMNACPMVKSLVPHYKAEGVAKDAEDCVVETLTLLDALPRQLAVKAGGEGSVQVAAAPAPAGPRSEE
jgi:hypothetical protein